MGFFYDCFDNPESNIDHQAIGWEHDPRSPKEKAKNRRWWKKYNEFCHEEEERIGKEQAEKERREKEEKEKKARAILSTKEVTEYVFNALMDEIEPFEPEKDVTEESEEVKKKIERQMYDFTLQVLRKDVTSTTRRERNSTSTTHDAST